MHQILLYYQYVTIEDPVEFMNQQRALCEKLGLKGRIIVAKEGLNGTVEGLTENTEKYVEIMRKDPRFEAMDFKRSIGDGKAFPRLSVKARSEIVSLHLGDEDINPREITGKYIYAEQLHEWIQSGKDFYIVDMRNDYEHRVGHFEGSLLPPMRNFRDLPQLLPTLAHLKNKTVVTVCTGGVRCEKASGFLVKHGFTDVYQLYGGIVTYMEKYPNEDFKGALYVFDNRVVMHFDRDLAAEGRVLPQREIVGRCERCGNPTENYGDCANLSCHLHFLCCKDCLDEQGNAYCPEDAKPILGAVV